LKNAGVQKRNRIIALCFVSVLLLIIYGPLSQWFVAADRFFYDQLASAAPNKPVGNTYIVSIDPARESAPELLQRYGDLVSKLKDAGASRIILPQPPEIPSNASLPSWAGLLKTTTPVFVPARHPLAARSDNVGFVSIDPDNDGVLRSTQLWYLNGDVKSPSLALAVALSSADPAAAQRIAGSKETIYFSNYAELPRLSDRDVLRGGADATLQGATVFVDAEPALVGADAVLPSGQYVTSSELTAAQLGDLEYGRVISTPLWATALEWLAPLLMAAAAVLVMPERNRRDIGLFAVVGIAILLIVQILLLLGLRVRIDIGRAILIYSGVAMLCAYLVADVKKESVDAFKKGSDFLSAGRLEPAFAEFRRCSPSETVAQGMYKLSLAFERQAKPERAEAVIDWMKRTNVGPQSTPAGTELSGDMPKRLGRYVIERRIGRGAMGAVYLAQDPRINRLVAVKAIPIEKEFEDDELKEARLRFYREAESAGRLTHPNITTVYDAGEDKGLAYIAMEYCHGISLKDFTKPTRLLAPKRALELAALTADALGYAHNQGVIHRDIKPANLIYNPKDASLKISDFGVARMTDNNSTKTGIVLGTPMYMSPEQLGAEDILGSSDLFSLGVTLYELLIGEAPFKATNIAVLMTKITTDNPEPVANRRNGIPSSADALLAKAMAKRPEDRFSSGAEMAVALRNCARLS